MIRFLASRKASPFTQITVQSNSQIRSITQIPNPLTFPAAGSQTGRCQATFSTDKAAPFL
jgi:hypothetical protein